ncbi:MAG TPA: Xaa-Pro peptidase family protein [Actinomycetes bacterium]|nr:Xaa-Pro peptidase family protein [Actinomycetes bacterium]
MPTSHQTRRVKLGEALSAGTLPAALVTDLVNVRYLTGFTGSAGAVLCLADGATWLATDGRYRTQAAAEAPDVESLITRTGPADLVALAHKRGVDRIGFEDEAMTVAEHQGLEESFPGELVGLGSAVTDLRLVKDEGELAALRKACLATDAAFAAVLPVLRPGPTERQVARWLDDFMRDLVPDGPGFETIAAAGENSATPHHNPTERVIESGDLLKLDFGAQVDGYHADMTRTVMIGRPADAWQQDIYDVVAEAQRAGRDALTATASGVEVDKAARTIIEAAGWGENFSHGLGHGVGLEIHEAPFLGATSTDRLAASVPVTVEPGIYLPGQGGVRIEDTVVVHHDRVEVLTTSTRELLVLD